MQLSRRRFRRIQRRMRARQGLPPPVRRPGTRTILTPEQRRERKYDFLVSAARGPAKSIAEGQSRRTFLRTIGQLRKGDLRSPITRTEFETMRLRLKLYRKARPEALYGMLTVCGFKMAFEMPGAEVLG